MNWHNVWQTYQRSHVRQRAFRTVILMSVSFCPIPMDNNVEHCSYTSCRIKVSNCPSFINVYHMLYLYMLLALQRIIWWITISSTILLHSEHFSGYTRDKYLPITLIILWQRGDKCVLLRDNCHITHGLPAFIILPMSIIGFIQQIDVALDCRPGKSTCLYRRFFQACLAGNVPFDK